MKTLFGNLMMAAVCLMATTLPARTAEAPRDESAKILAARCSSILSKDFAAIPEAPTQVTSAAVVAGTEAGPAHCLVSAYIVPNVGIDIRLPDPWNGKMAMVGCGGFCGRKAELSACGEVLRRGYACIATDMGHQSTPWDAKWAYNNLQAVFDFGLRATHVSAVAGKALVTAFYGDPARLSYFLGCSTGGRQAYVEAERYPQDFDGIVAGAPIMSEAEDDLTLFWNVLATLAPDGRQVFTTQALELLHRSVVEACDMNDGVKDGLIGDPRQCHFDPSVLQCRNTNAGSCLNAEQIEAARRIYQGPVTSSGRAVSKAVVLPGSELNWRGAYVGANGEPAEFYSFIGDALQYLLFTPALGPQWDPRTIDWDRDPERVRTLESLYNAQNPDLRQFQARRGKLLGFHGWADHSSPPYFSTDYYEMVSRVMGGTAATQSFYRLFMVPGMGHCSGGEGADHIDYLTYLQEWVEHDHPPEQLIGQHPKKDDKQWLVFGKTPLAAPQVTFTRPIFPYPARAHYVGGDPTQAANFSAD